MYNFEVERLKKNVLAKSTPIMAVSYNFKKKFFYVLINLKDEQVEMIF